MEREGGGGGVLGLLAKTCLPTPSASLLQMRWDPSGFAFGNAEVESNRNKCHAFLNSGRKAPSHRLAPPQQLCIVCGGGVGVPGTSAFSKTCPSLPSTVFLLLPSSHAALGRQPRLFKARSAQRWFATARLCLVPRTSLSVSHTNTGLV